MPGEAVRGHDQRGVAGAEQAGSGSVRDPGVHFDRYDTSAFADPLGEQGGVPAGSRADLQHAVARAHVELLEHGGDQGRLAARTGRAQAHAVRWCPAVVDLGDDRFVRLDQGTPPGFVVGAGDGGESVTSGVFQPDHGRNEPVARYREPST
ncbi:hypothetical protein FHR84_002235 [Actinopolyspora biskrensis]|uniref:Uncharacterized protein n=1 Tax=Actinopolyspora biskrensis TaxID=1470178 RepID=A0A852YY18_9ACTN|nr:hypothetical protein [Actinopolyspora biskrensis]NYH78910.1 hypothetical protein [Actinopolyspora biskrensis]